MTFDDAPIALVVEEDSELLTDAYQRLESQGYRVATRRCLLDALRYATAAKPALILVGVLLWDERVVARLRGVPGAHVHPLTCSDLMKGTYSARRSLLGEAPAAA
jgi:ActR/RegA family two-component response regulator